MTRIGSLPLIIHLLAGGTLAWAFLPTLQFMVDKWSTDPQYSHGFLVPAFSVYWLWRKAKENPNGWFGPSWPLLATLLLIPAVGLRALAGGMLFHQLDCIALAFALTAWVLITGGGKLLYRSTPAWLFLAFAVPLPYEMERNVGAPLRLVATESSTYLLQTLSLPAISEGNIILIDEHRLEVAEACSGLKMLVTFAAFSVGAVMLARRTWFEHVVVVLGILPIAVVVNVLRITATGLVCSFDVSKQTLHQVHDIFGWLMMPVGLGFLALEYWALDRLVLRNTHPTGAK